MEPAVVAFRGELDISRYTEVCEALAHEPAGNGPVLLDLRELVSTDSLCLSEMLLFRHRMEEVNRPLAAVVASPNLYRVFAIANVIEMLNVYRTYQEAVVALEHMKTPLSY